MLLNRFQEALATYTFPQMGQVSISIGCAKMIQNVLPNTVLERTDEVLYYAKKHGKNQICYYEMLVVHGLLRKDSLITGEIELF